METGLKRRAVIVAASSQGIARAAAAGFAAEGARVAMCARNQQAIEAAAGEIKDRYGADVFSQALDVTDAEAVRLFVQQVAHRFGGVDVCVTNAGGPPAKGFLATTYEEWRRAIELNLMSTIYFAREVIPYMQRNRWGRIIAITSVAVRQPVQDLVYSNAVRAGVVGLVKSLSNEFGKDGILVNNVAPGYTLTDRLKELAGVRALAAGITPEDVFERWAQDTAVRRLARPEEVADAIVWLASERASYITGQTILVDGGTYKGI